MKFPIVVLNEVTLGTKLIAVFFLCIHDKFTYKNKCKALEYALSLAKCIKIV